MFRPQGPVACCCLVLRSGWAATSGAYTPKVQHVQGT